MSWTPRRGEQVIVVLGGGGLSPELRSVGRVVSLGVPLAWRSGSVTVDVQATQLRHVVDAARVRPMLRAVATADDYREGTG